MEWVVPRVPSPLHLSPFSPPDGDRRVDPPALSGRVPGLPSTPQDEAGLTRKFELLPMYGIARSMSRAGTPTDNAAMEAINGWIKAELFTDLHVTGERSVQEEVDEYIAFFNELRPAYALNYLTPKQYRESFSPVPAV